MPLPHLRSTVSLTRVARVAAVALLAAASACGGSPEASEGSVAAADTIRTVTLGHRDIALVALEPLASGIAISGSLDPAEQVEVKSQIAGQVTGVPVDRGTPVRRGQVLATIDASATRAQVASAEASLAAAERDLRAADTLYKAGAISERDFVQARVARDAARAQVTLHRETLARATVTSPITGIVSTKSIEPGEIVQVAGTLFTIVNSDPLELAGGVAASAVGGIAVGQPVTLSADAYPGRQITGRVARIEPVAEEGTRQVRVYVRVPNPGYRLVAGVFATGTILRNAGASLAVPTIPRSAVRTIGGQPTVFAVDAGRIAERQVVLGSVDADRGLVEVRSGIAAGTRILVNPDSTVRAGMPVRVLTDSATVATPSRGGN